MKNRAVAGAGWSLLLAVLLSAAPAAATRIVQVRVGHHPTFTRVVFELDAPAGYRIERRVVEGGALELVISVDAASSSRTINSRSAMVERVVVVSKPNRSEAVIRLRKKSPLVKELILTNPPRLVFDVMLPEADLAKAAAPPPKPAPAAEATAGQQVTEKQRLVEEKRLAQEKHAAEQKRLVDGKRAAKQKRVAEQQQLAEEKRLAEEQQAAEQKRLAEEKQAAEQKRLSEEQQAAEQKRLTEEQQAAEQSRLADEKRLAEEQQAAGAKLSAEEKQAAELVEPPKAAQPPVAKTPVPPQAPRPVVTTPAVPLRPAEPGIRWVRWGAVVAGALAVLIGVVLFVRQRAIPNDLDVTTLADWENDEGTSGSEGFVVGESDENATGGDQRTVAEVLASGSSGIAAGPGSFDESEKGESEMDRESMDVGGVSEGAGVAGAGGDITSLVRELERRVAQIETRLDESVDARERLERQVAAQSEELRVQRAAIARTQRALRSLNRSDEDNATEPALREPSKGGEG